MKSRIFDSTYTTRVDYGYITQANGFYDDGAGEFEKKGSFYADVQPYNGGLAEKEYGQVGEVNLRIYYPPDAPDLDAGTAILIDGRYYLLTYSETWESGRLALLRLRHDI